MNQSSPGASPQTTGIPGLSEPTVPPSGATVAGPTPLDRDASLDRPAPPTRVTLRDGSRAWLISRYTDVRTVLSDPRFSADDQNPDFPRLVPLPPFPGGLSFIRMDPPRHSVLRRVLTPRFTVRRIEALRPEIQRMTDEMLTAMAESGPPADLVEDFALPLPSLTICQLLGVPYQDHEMFQAHSRNTVATDVSPETANASFAVLHDYLRELTAAKRAQPKDDLISHALSRQEAAELSDDDVVAMARLMLIAGHETTANMISMSTLALLQHPKQLAVLREQPELMPSAVEELLRYLSVVRNGIGRVATEDTRLSSGVVVSSGDGVIIDFRGANHDPAAFADTPAELDIRRSPRGHVAFGYGVHQCIGQALARVELQIALTELIRRFPGLRLAVPPEEIEIHEQAIIIAATSLPVVW